MFTRACARVLYFSAGAAGIGEVTSEYYASLVQNTSVLTVVDIVLLARGAALEVILLRDLILDAVLASVVADLLGVELGQDLGSLDVADVLVVSLGENDIDFLEGATGLGRISMNVRSVELKNMLTVSG